MKNYRFVDYATQGYLLLVALLALVFQNERTPLAPYLVGAHILVVILIHALIRYHAAHRTGRFIDFLRYFYPILLFTGFYRETGALHHMFFADFLDPWLIRLEARLFGMQPSLEFMDRLPYLAVSELLYAAYFTYYIMIVGIGFALFIRNRTHFYHYVSVLSFVFYVCYLTYIIVPVMGPRAFYGGMGYELPAEVHPDVPPPYPDAVQVGPFFKVMRVIYHNLEAPGAAFSKQSCRHRHSHGLVLIPIPPAHPLSAPCGCGVAVHFHSLLSLPLCGGRVRRDGHHGCPHPDCQLALLPSFRPCRPRRPTQRWHNTGTR